MILQLLLLLATYVSFGLSGQKSTNILSDCPPGFIFTPTEEFITIKYLEVVGCSKQPCTFFKTEYVEINGLAVAHFTSPSVIFVCTAITPLGPIVIYKGDMGPYISPGRDFKPEMEIVINIKKRIDEFVLPFQGSIRFSMVDTSGKALFCSNLNVTIKELPIKVLNVDLSESLFG